MQIDLHKGDCLDVMKDIPDGSVDLVLTDPPYGTMNRKTHRPEKRLDDITWDFALDEKVILSEIKRVLRPNGKACLFCQEPYTSKLILCDVPSLAFVQRLAWKKNVAGNFLCASQNCMQYIEDIVCFRKDYAVYDVNKSNPQREYFFSELQKSGLTVQEVNTMIGTKSMANHYFTNGIQFSIPSKRNYEKLQETGFFKIPYERVKREFDEFQSKLLSEKNRQYPSVFNIWKGGKSKSNVLEYSKDNDGFHPTQKPVLLLEDLIKTYSNDGDTVLDFTMGSGSTGVACINTGRNFIGIELDEGYFKIAQERIEAAQKDAEKAQMSLFTTDEAVC